MRSTLLLMRLALVVGALPAMAQGVGDGVILTGGLGPSSAPASPAQAPSYSGPVVYQMPVIYQPTPCAVPAYTALAGGYYNPNVIYFGGPNSCYRNCYVGCTYSPNVLYFGRGQAYYQGYAFTAYR
jgi:hypothetical protein